jgi:hypothetical protein
MIHDIHHRKNLTGIDCHGSTKKVGRGQRNLQVAHGSVAFIARHRGETAAFAPDTFALLTTSPCSMVRGKTCGPSTGTSFAHPAGRALCGLTEFVPEPDGLTALISAYGLITRLLSIVKGKNRFQSAEIV